MPSLMHNECPKCRKTAKLRRGRCAVCGTALDVVQIARHERRAAVVRFVAGEWYWWLGEIAAVVLVGLVVADALPVWTLAVAALLLVRAASRALLLLVRGGLELTG
jgi:hypothetical protein